MSFITSYFRGTPQQEQPQLKDLKAEGEGKGAVDETRSRTLWQLLSNAIGMDLSAGFTIPVWYCEHSSNLTKMVEMFEYEEILEKASAKQTPLERLACIGLFIISGYSNCLRTQKPLNPLLGETFEFVDERRGIRAFAEQISHHPPISVSHIEHESFTFWQQAHIRSKFLGNSCDLFPCADSSIYFHDNGDYYRWVPASTRVHNMIIGSIWLEVYGDIVVENLSNGDKMTITIDSAGWFGRYSYNVKGICKTKSGLEAIKIEGKWSAGAEATWVSDEARTKYARYLNTPEGRERIPLEVNRFPRSVREREEARMKAKKPATQLKPNEKNVVCQWVVPPNNFSRIYGMTEFADDMVRLEKDDDYYYSSDSRLRPDLRTLAASLSERAIYFKAFLEEEQRKDRKAFAQSDGPSFKWKPVWFKPIDETNYVYDGGYWEHVAALRGEKVVGGKDPKSLGLNVKQIDGLAMDFHRYNFADYPENLTPAQRAHYQAKAQEKKDKKGGNEAKEKEKEKEKN